MQAARRLQQLFDVRFVFLEAPDQRSALSRGVAAATGQYVALIDGLTCVVLQLLLCHCNVAATFLPASWAPKCLGEVPSVLPASPRLLLRALPVGASMACPSELTHPNCVPRQ